jgi:hypothetical protein
VLYVAPLCPELVEGAGHLPRKGGDQAGRFAGACLATLVIGEIASESEISPLAGEMAGRPEGGAKELGSFNLEESW